MKITNWVWNQVDLQLVMFLYLNYKTNKKTQNTKFKNMFFIILYTHNPEYKIMINHVQRTTTIILLPIWHITIDSTYAVMVKCFFGGGSQNNVPPEILIWISTYQTNASNTLFWCTRDTRVVKVHCKSRLVKEKVRF